VSAAPPSPLPPTWTHWYRRALPAYWIFLFILTHFPKLEFGVPVPSSDKLAHFGAFALLTFLFWRFAEARQRPLSARCVWLAAAVLLIYSAVDEYTQQFVGRSTDLSDWLCDLAGVALVLGWLEWRRRHNVRRTRESVASTPAPR
jgi:VanZ family protein